MAPLPQRSGGLTAIVVQLAGPTADAQARGEDRLRLHRCSVFAMMLRDA